MQLCLTKLSVILEIDPYVISLDFFFFSERIIAATSNYRGMSAKNDYYRKKEIVRIYANSKYLDRNVRWLFFILAEYISANGITETLLLVHFLYYQGHPI